MSTAITTLIEQWKQAVVAGYPRINGQWKVVHEHWSTPFDRQSGAGLFDLKP